MNDGSISDRAKYQVAHHALDTSIEDHMSWWVILGYAGAFAMGILGCLLGGALGWLFDQGGLDTILGSFAGFALFFFIGFCLFGPASHMYGRITAFAAPPELARWQMTGFRKFDLYVTIHRANNVINSEFFNMFGKQNDAFIEVQCGRLVDEDTFIVGKNTTKRTCVRQDCIFEEVFTFVVHPTDDTLRVILYDQDMVATDKVGMCDLNITDDVLHKGFPQKQGFMLGQEPGFFHEEKRPFRCGVIIMSFSPGKNFPSMANHEIANKVPIAREDLRNCQHHLANEIRKDSTSYGTWVQVEGHVPAAANRV